MSDKEKAPLSVTHPEIAVEWHPTKNGDLTPSVVSHGSTKMAWWLCEKGHTYKGRIDHRCIMRSGCPYCSGKRPIVGENDLATTHPQIAAEWDADKNAKTPSDFKAGSNKTAHWICSVCGAGYEKRICDRIYKNVGCPNCSAERATSFNEQAIAFYLGKLTNTENRTKHFGREIDVFLPRLNIGIEYNGGYYHRNKRAKDSAKADALASRGVRLITVDEGKANASSGEAVTVRTKDYHVRDADLGWAITELCRICGLPEPDVDLRRDRYEIRKRYIISEKEENLAKQYPDIAAEWDYEKNLGMKPGSYLPGSNHKAWWKCAKCGESYEQAISNRTVGGTGCPVCAGKKTVSGLNDVATTHPALVPEWHPTKNGDLLPSMVSKGSDRKAWWVCPLGHEWEATISSRTQGRGCPVCAGRRIIPGINDLVSLRPDLAAEWHPTKNGDLTPEGVGVGSCKRVWWLCEQGHEWQAVIYSRKNCGCPICSKSKTSRI